MADLDFDELMRIDHLVWYNSDLAAGQRFFAESMDCAPAYGGEHPGEGTANAVMALGVSPPISKSLGAIRRRATPGLIRK
jgi:hypothetical protein